MKKLALLAAFLMVFALAIGVAETEKPLTLSGSVEFSIGEEDIKAAPGAAFDAGKTGVVATLEFGTETDKVQAGVTLNLSPAITKTDGVDNFGDIVDIGAPGLAVNADGLNAYDYLQAAADWAHYKVNNGTYLDDTGATVSFGAVFDAETWDVALGIAGQPNDLISGAGPWTVLDLDDVDDADKPTDLSANIAAIADNAIVDWVTFWGAIPLANFAIDADGTAFVVEDGTAAEIAAAKAMVEFYDDWKEDVFGEVTDDSWASSFPITNAYLKVNRVLGVVDIMAELMGKAVGVGSMVTSAYKGTAGNDANYGFSVALSDGVVSGVSASVLVTGWDEDLAAAVSQDYETWVDDTADAVEPVWGAQLDLGYATDMFGAMVQLAMPDFAADPFIFAASLQPFVTLPDLYGLFVKGEFDMVSNDGFGMAAAASVGASVFGIAPSVTFWWKNDEFGGDDTTNAASGADDITDDAGLAAEFGSTDLDSATALALAATIDLADLLGMKLITVSGGYDMLLSGSKNMGWNAGVGLDFAEVLGMPLTLSFDIAKWAAEDLTWAAVLGYTYDALGVSFTFEQTEADVYGWALAGSVSF